MPVSTADSGDISIRYLLCHEHVREGIWAAKSLLADDRMRKWKLVFHDDGTLSSKDVNILRSHFPSATVILKEEADREMERILPPACKSLRKNFVTNVKLFDFAHFSDGKAYLALDADVLFFGNPDELYETLTEAGTFIRWNQDPPTARSFSHSEEEIFEKTGIRATRFNSGLVAVPRPFTKWDQIETWLSAMGEPQSWTVEQTVFALVAFSQGGQPLPNTYDILETYWPDVISEHYYWRSRRNMYRYGYPRVYEERLNYCCR